MGGCCGSGSKILVKYDGRQEVFDHVADFNSLKLHITEKLQVPYFDVLIDGKLISSNEEFRPFLHSRTMIEITVKKKEPELIKPPVKQTEASKIQLKVPSQLEEHLYEIVDKSEKPMVSTILLSNCHLLVHKQYVPKVQTSLSFKPGDEKEKMIPVQEYGNFLLYKIERMDHPSLPLENCSDFTKKAQIHSNKIVNLVQNKHTPNLYEPSEYLNSNYLGFPVFKKSQLVGFISSVTENSATIVSASEIVNKFIPSTIKQKKTGDPKPIIAPKIPITAIKFVNSPERPPVIRETIEINRDVRAFQEKEGGDEEIVMEMNFDFGAKGPEQFCYGFFPPNRLLSYNSTHLSMNEEKVALKIEEGASFTSTTKGLLVVSGKSSWLVNHGVLEPLEDLKFEHNFHAAVVHKNKFYMISGRGCINVEFLDEQQPNWTSAQSLQVSRENAAVISNNEYIYLAGGKEGHNLIDSVLRFKRNWELLTWVVPWKLEGMGAVLLSPHLIFFGGYGKIMTNHKFAMLNLDGKELNRGELPATGFFSGKSVGLCDGVYSFMIDQGQVLEFQHNFKLVAVAL